MSARASLSDPGIERIGSTRFIVDRRIGEGGMGVVLEAFDRERRERVAIKVLKEHSALGMARFKREFRALAGVAHPNLVSLYELHGDDQRLFFSMELVQGADFLAHVCGQPGGAPGEADTLPQACASEDHRRLGAPHLDRLRNAMRQLTSGVIALHEAGKLHRDLKPSNVLVTRQGRVVILDFGLVLDLDERARWVEPGCPGTWTYMSPEQRNGRPPSPASDWFAVGVMLGQALSGLGGRAPEDLAELAEDLQHEAPDRRPAATEILRRLAGDAAGRGDTAQRAGPLPFVGRAGQLRELELAFDRARRGEVTLAYVAGRSGMGKSALVSAFLDGLRETNAALVIEGRCYERESVPYNAIDSLVDGLATHLGTLPLETATQIMPRDVWELARLFPVLGDLEAVAPAPRRVDSSDPIELRRRAFGALRELIARLAEHLPVVLLIDDLQWGDLDSALLLAELVRPPDPPAILLVATYRAESDRTSPLLRALRQRGAPAWPIPDLSPLRPDGTERVREIDVGPLTHAEALALATTLARDDPRLLACADRIARESAGSPYFVHVLSEHVRASGSYVEQLTLDEVLAARITGLPDPARELLEVVALAGGPVALGVLQHATRSGSLQQALHVLRARGLLHTSPARDGGRVDTSHDRIREAVVRLSDSLRPRHLALAQALEDSEDADAQQLAIHYQRAGHDAQAFEHLHRAALLADQALAFDRATKLYALALAQLPEAARREPLQLSYAAALANAGRGAEAARIYLELATGNCPWETTELRRLAAQHLLRSGHLDEGLKTIQTISPEIERSANRGPRSALVRLGLTRARLRLRGLGFRERPSAELDPAELRRLDLSWSAAEVLGMVDTMRSGALLASSLAKALDTGEPYRISRQLSMEAIYAATAGGTRGPRRARGLIVQARSLAERLDHPHALGVADLASGFTGYLSGDFRAARAAAERAEATLRARCTGARYETVTAQLCALWSLFYLGEAAELTRRVPELLRDAEQRGDVYAATNLCIGIPNLCWLFGNEVAEARQKVRSAQRRWSQRGFHLQHYFNLHARTHIDLYTGDGHAALRRLDDHQAALERSLLLHIQIVRLEHLDLRARAALLASRSAPDPAPLLRAATRDARRIARERMPWATALSHMVLAGVASVRGDSAIALTRLADAEAAFDAAGMALHAAVARCVRGPRLGGADGDRLAGLGWDYLHTQRILSPARIIGMLAPGL